MLAFEVWILRILKNSKTTLSSVFICFAAFTIIHKNVYMFKDVKAMFWKEFLNQEHF